MRRLRQPAENDTGRSPRWIIIEAVAATRGAAIYTWLIVALAILPLLLLTGVAGSFLPPMLIAYAVASLVGLVVALTLTPALASLLLPQAQRPQRVGGASRRLAGTYRSALAAALTRSRAIFAAGAVVTVAVVAAAGLTIAGQADGGFMPQFKERDLIVAVEAAPGTSAEALHRIAARAGAELRSVPGVSNVGGHVGRAVTSDQVVGTDSGAIWVTIDRNADYATTRSAVENVVAGYPGLALRVGTYTNDRIDAVLDTPQRDVVVRVYGQDQATIRQKADEVSAALSGVNGLTAVALETQVDQPTLQIEVDLPAAERLGLKPGDVRRATTTLLSGLEVGLIFEEQKVFQVIVWGAPEIRGSLDAVRNLPIQTAGGGSCRSRRSPRWTSPHRRRSCNARVSSATWTSAPPSAVGISIASCRTSTARSRDPFPFEYRAEILGSAAERQALLYRLIAVTVGVLIGVLLLLQAAFSSWRRAAGLLVTLPAALLGAFVVVWLLGGSLSIGVIGGLIVVFAFAVRHGILIVDQYQRLEHEPGANFDPDLILGGAQARFAPLLISAAVIALVAAPLVVLGGGAGLEILRPMAAVVLGGLVTSTIFALFVVPVVVFGTGPSPEPESEGQTQVEQPSLSPA